MADTTTVKLFADADLKTQTSELPLTLDTFKDAVVLPLRMNYDQLLKDAVKSLKAAEAAAATARTVNEEASRKNDDQAVLDVVAAFKAFSGTILAAVQSVQPSSVIKKEVAIDRVRVHVRPDHVRVVGGSVSVGRPPRKEDDAAPDPSIPVVEFELPYQVQIGWTPEQIAAEEAMVAADLAKQQAAQLVLDLRTERGEALERAEDLIRFQYAKTAIASNTNFGALSMAIYNDDFFAGMAAATPHLSANALRDAVKPPAGELDAPADDAAPPAADVVPQA